ncbi:MAG: helix-hairpin-helix domain-containing protein, partial [Bacteroidota bacterium]
MLRKFIKDYLVFGRRDRMGIIAVVVLIALIYLLPYLAPKPTPLVLKQGNVLLAEVDSSADGRRPGNEDDENLGQTYSYQPSTGSHFSKGELFEFDPNTVSIDGWQRLGLSAKTAKTIDKYRSKGGKFYKSEDLQKIWGLPKGFYERVKSYISIASIEKQFPKNSFERKPFEKTERKFAPLSINETDTSAWIALPGIGSKLAGRIVAFREKLGGFYSVEQIGETYGLPDSTFQKIKGRLKLSGELRKINVNTATK